MLAADEGGVDQRPLATLAPACRRHLPDRAAHDAVMQEHDGDAHQVRLPFLVQGDDTDHHEEEEVRFRHTAGHVDEHGGGEHQARRAGYRTSASRTGGVDREKDRREDERCLTEAVQGAESPRDAEEEQPDGLDRGKRSDAAMAGAPHLVGERSSLGKPVTQRLVRSRERGSHLWLSVDFAKS
jgi:hypothetical protein